MTPLRPQVSYGFRVAPCSAAAVSRKKRRLRPHVSGVADVRRRNVGFAMAGNPKAGLFFAICTSFLLVITAMAPRIPL
jgi:hypothetical protein